MPRFVRFGKRRSLIALTLIILVASATAAEKEYTYCWAASLNSGSNIQFFSNVFLADTSDWKEWQHMEVTFQKYMIVIIETPSWARRMQALFVERNG